VPERESIARGKNLSSQARNFPAETPTVDGIEQESSANRPYFALVLAGGFGRRFAREYPRTAASFAGRSSARVRPRRKRGQMKLLDWASVPAKESHLAVVLGFSVLMMSALLWMVVWQADVISYQQDVIRWLWSSAVR